MKEYIQPIFWVVVLCIIVSGCVAGLNGQSKEHAAEVIARQQAKAQFMTHCLQRFGPDDCGKGWDKDQHWWKGE